MLGYLLPWCTPDYETLPSGRQAKAKRIAVFLWILIVLLFGAVAGVAIYWTKWRNTGSSAIEKLNWRRLGAECATAPAKPEDRRRDKDRLRVASFNTEWLFMEGGTCPGPKCAWKSKKEAEAHLQQVAKTIYALDADIVNVLEVESCRTLARMLSLMPADHGYRPYVIKSTDTSTGQTLGLLTRVDPVESLQRSKERVSFPVPQSECPAAGVSGKTGSTKHYVTRFEVKNGSGRVTSFVIGGAHFLSQPLDKKRCPRREGQASVVKQALERAAKPGDRIIILGDFNDTDNSFKAAGGAESISGVLDILRSTGGKRLGSVAELVGQSERYSAWWDVNGNCEDDGGKEHSLIDHILVSPDWNIESVKADHSYAVSCRERISDHWPLMVTFKIN